MKAELVQREDIAESLKKQNRELRHTLNLQASGKDLSMYAPSSQSNLEGPSHEARKSYSSGKYVQNSETRKVGKALRSKTPVRD